MVHATCIHCILKNDSDTLSTHKKDTRIVALFYVVPKCILSFLLCNKLYHLKACILIGYNASTCASFKNTERTTHVKLRTWQGILSNLVCTLSHQSPIIHHRGDFFVIFRILVSLQTESGRAESARAAKFEQWVNTGAIQCAFSLNAHCINSYCSSYAARALAVRSLSVCRGLCYFG